MRLIDADKLKEALLGEWYVEPNATIFDYVFDLIDNAPTVELNDKSLEIAKKSIELGRKIGKLEGKLERPQGEWVEAEITEEYRQYGFDLRVVCSRCGSEQSYFDFNEYHEPVAVTFIRSRFCSFCGARMIKDFTGEAIP